MSETKPVTIDDIIEKQKENYFYCRRIGRSVYGCANTEKGNLEISYSGIMPKCC